MFDISNCYEMKKVYFNMFSIVYLGTYVSLEKMTLPLKRISKLVFTELKSQFFSSISV